MNKNLSTEKLLDEFINRCRAKGLKITPQRIAIYKEVVTSEEHPSAEIIYRKIKPLYPNISFDTVNRTLLSFTEMGLIEIVEFTGISRRYDPNTEKHHHFVCRQCGNIIDFYCNKFDSLDIPEEIKEKAMIKKIRVILEGICNNCKKDLEH
ncbi:MAG: transcriptional repressor [Syntrophorhabdaceae bacterium]|nr:transcriptional repressor [Syntrophorhabdaceae bacterium]